MDYNDIAASISAGLGKKTGIYEGWEEARIERINRAKEQDWMQSNDISVHSEEWRQKHAAYLETVCFDVTKNSVSDYLEDDVWLDANF